MAAGTKKVSLIRKTSKTFLWISLVLMLVSTIALYFYVRYLLQKEVEEELRSTEARIENVISGKGLIYQLAPVVEIKNVSVLGTERFKDTVIFDPSQNEMEEFRELSTYSEINGKKYNITVRALIVESEYILIAIMASYLIIIALVFIFFFYLNKSGNQRLWHPFFRNLEEMKGFSLNSEKPVQLVESDILEFSELNTVISTLTDKVRSDYKNLKQYTEDVSHEMQTPLAIIQAKIENIINGDNLNDIQYEHLTSIQQDIYRLTQMNKRLTLLTKIENQQFANPEVLNLNLVVKKRIQNFNEIFPDKIKFEEANILEVLMDHYLAEVLCDNLISNALKYSAEKKAITISIGHKTLMVSNQGEAKLQNPEKLFTRFYRETSHIKSTGLGLAIVQKICDLYGYKPSYSFADHRHIFKVEF
jgi:signal transduction histidine kinase